MKYSYPIKQDGILYNAGEEVPDMGSLVCVSIDGIRRTYKGLDADKGKLPKYDTLGTGSTFMATDSDTYMEYDASVKEWKEK